MRISETMIHGLFYEGHISSYVAPANAIFKSMFPKDKSNKIVLKGIFLIICSMDQNKNKC